MTDNIRNDLGSVQITMLLPLWGRAVEMQKKRPMLIDKTAAEIINKIDFDFVSATKNLHDITRFEWIARCMHIDREIKEFIRRYPDGTIVNIGCGLDTTFDRIDNGKLLWYDLDLPDAIEFRRKFICEGDRRKIISCSFLDDSWFGEIGNSEHVLFISAGVMYYFEEAQVKEIICKMAKYFPGASIVFDAASSFGVQTANKKVIESSGLDERSYLHWGLDNPSIIKDWDENIDQVNYYLMFKGMTKGLSLKNKLMARISDHYKIMYMVHLKFGKI